MSAGAKKGFTIVELLVVITIIGLLMALLLPAVNSARRTAREAQCMNNSRSLGQAMLGHATAKEYFPGRLSNLPTNSGVLEVSWFVRLLPYLERNDLHDALKDGIFSQNTYLEMAVCPSDPPATLDAPHLNHVANTGVWDSDWRDSPANGVCHNLVANSKQAKQAIRAVQVSLSYISKHDGTTTTLLLSENVDARFWISTSAMTEGDTGIVWLANLQSQLGVNEDTGLAAMTMNPRFSRPSSRHTGIVMATFCDGHSIKLNEEVDKTVYARLMTPSGKGSRPGPKSDTPEFQIIPVSDNFNL